MMKQLKILEQSDVLWVKEQINLLSKFTNDESDDSTNTVQEKLLKRLHKKAKEITDFSQYYDSSSDEEEDDKVN